MGKAARTRASLIPALALLALAALYPTYYDSLPTDVPVIQAFPQVSTAVIMIVFIMMAVGLNIVVGYCGLLDLGYVAFYAVGAYTGGWLASGHFQQVNIHLGSVGISPDVRGIHINMWVVLLLAGSVTALAGILIGLPTLRLRGDYLAIVTLGFGEIIPAVRPQRRRPRRASTSRRGAFGINPIDTPGFGDGAERHARAARELPAVVRQDQPLLLQRARAAADHDLLLDPAPRLAAGPRVDRHPRGRDRGRGDGRPAHAHEDLGVRDRRLLRRGRRRLLRELQGRRVPERVLLQHLGLPALHGHSRRDGKRLGRRRRRARPHVAEPGRACQHRRLAQRRDAAQVRGHRGTSSGSTASSSC